MQGHNWVILRGGRRYIYDRKDEIICTWPNSPSVKCVAPLFGDMSLAKVWNAGWGVHPTAPPPQLHPWKHERVHQHFYFDSKTHLCNRPLHSLFKSVKFFWVQIHTTISNPVRGDPDSRSRSSGFTDTPVALPTPTCLLVQALHLCPLRADQQIDKCWTWNQHIHICSHNSSTRYQERS